MPATQAKRVRVFIIAFRKWEAIGSAEPHAFYSGIDLHARTLQVCQARPGTDREQVATDGLHCLPPKHTPTALRATAYLPKRLGRWLKIAGGFLIQKCP